MHATPRLSLYIWHSVSGQEGKNMTNEEKAETGDVRRLSAELERAKREVSMLNRDIEFARKELELERKNHKLEVELIKSEFHRMIQQYEAETAFPLVNQLTRFLERLSRDDFARPDPGTPAQTEPRH